MEIRCVNCGAYYEEGSYDCPYCGHITPDNAEAKYMDALEDIKDDLHELADDGEEAAIEEGKSLAKRILIPVFIFLLILGVCALIFVVPKTIKNKANAKWQVVNYARFQQMYNDEDYDTLLDEYLKAKADEKPVYGFKHAAFCDALDVLNKAKNAYDYVDSKESVDDYWNIELFYNEMKCFAFDYEYGLTVKERDMVKEKAEPYKDDATLRYGLSSAELDEWMKKIEEEKGYVSYTDCREYLEKKGMIKEDNQ
ncbi:MAG: hypothetical protein II699_01040 [Lachnospiraceae bacterium]|nr:hypothetical protein [Lachnospiraceae bacterium]